MYGMGGGLGTGVVGVASTTAAAIVLPNTGSHKTLTVVAGVTLAVGILILASTAARFVAKKAYKA